jgi:hypothetical protein
VAVLLALAALRQETAEVSILRLLVWPGLYTYTIPDPIILSNNKSANAESETDYSNPEVDLTTKSDFSSLYIADSDMADGKGFGSGTIYISDRIVADHQGAADVPGSASPGHGSVIHQATPIRVNTEITQGSGTYDALDVTKKAEEGGINVFADNEDNANTCSTRRSGSSAVSSDNPASDSNVSLSEL